MPKHRLLGIEEFRQYTPSHRLIQFLRDYFDEVEKSPEELPILDWGCGRGEDVLWLLENGYDAYGVEIDAEPVENGRPLFQELGYDPSRLHLIGEDGKTGFSDEYFYLIISDQVIEHIRYLEPVAEEMYRITKPGGLGYHQFPAHLRIKEVHLHMPFLQWLPKSRLRKALIAFYVQIGKEADWPELRSASHREKADTYYRYSIEKTYYRPKRKIRHTFQQYGYQVSFAPTLKKRMQKKRVFRLLAKSSLLRKILWFFKSTFKRVELKLSKPEQTLKSNHRRSGRQPLVETAGRTR